MRKRSSARATERELVVVAAVRVRFPRGEMTAGEYLAAKQTLEVGR